MNKYNYLKILVRERDSIWKTFTRIIDDGTDEEIDKLQYLMKLNKIAIEKELYCLKEQGAKANEVYKILWKEVL